MLEGSLVTLLARNGLHNISRHFLAVSRYFVDLAKSATAIASITSSDRKRALSHQISFTREFTRHSFCGVLEMGAKNTVNWRIWMIDGLRFLL